MAVSTTISDQALGREMQFIDGLIAEPIPFGDFGMELSWPEDADIKWKIRGKAEEPTVRTANGYTILEVDLPLPEQPEMPQDAPLRYLIPPMIAAPAAAGAGPRGRL